MCTFNVTNFLFPVGWILEWNRGEILPGHQSLLHPQTRETREEKGRTADGGDNIASLILLPFPAYTRTLKFQKKERKKSARADGCKGKWGGGTFFFRPAKAAEGPRGFLKGENHRLESEVIVFCFICLIVFANIFPKCITSFSTFSTFHDLFYASRNMCRSIFYKRCPSPSIFVSPPFFSECSEKQSGNDVSQLGSENVSRGLNGEDYHVIT